MFHTKFRNRKVRPTFPQYYVLLGVVFVNECVGYCNCSEEDFYEDSPADSDAGQLQLVSPSITIGVLLGGVFVLLVSVLICCMFCPCSICILSNRRYTRSDDSQMHEIERGMASSSFEDSSSSVSQFSRSSPIRRTVTVSSVVILYENRDSNFASFRNQANLDPPPPYPGKSGTVSSTTTSAASRSSPIWYINDDHPPPYSPSL